MVPGPMAARWLLALGGSPYWLLALALTSGVAPTGAVHYSLTWAVIGWRPRSFMGSNRGLALFLCGEISFQILKCQNHLESNTSFTFNNVVNKQSQVAGGRGQVTFGRWQVAGGRWYVAGGRW